MSEKRFVVDSMLGRLAKWLRVMGFDTHYQLRYELDEIRALVAEGRIFITRKTRWLESLPSAIVVEKDRVSDQIKDLVAIGLLRSSPGPFTRCIRCNSVLEMADIDTLDDHVPEYVVYESGNLIKRCPSCGRYYWPGSHKERMKRQLRLWGVSLLETHSPVGQRNRSTAKS